MKKLANDSSAISEIIGALMLVLIVVIAASAFALFISQQQKIQQDNQLIEDQKAGESLLISSLSLNRTHPTDTIWTSLNVTVSSLDQGSSQIDRISINGYPLKSFQVARFNATSNGNVYVNMNYNQTFVIPSQQIVNIYVNMSDFFGAVKLPVDGPIDCDIFTAYSNEFQKVYYPPTSIISIDTESQWNSSDNNYTSFLILDGSQSDQPGDSTIVKWSWTIEDSTGIHLLDGRKVRYYPLPSGHGVATISLEVQNSNGLLGNSTTTYNF